LRQAAKVRPTRGIMPILSKAGTCTPNCKAPPIITPTASANTGSTPCDLNSGATKTAAPITDRLSSTGVTAGTAKRLQVLRMPALSATSDMKPM